MSTDNESATEERRRLRATFDQVALLYDRARPTYPEAHFDDVVSLSGVPPAGRVLEIGCGTGQATVPLARRGFHVLCIELGEILAAAARRKVAAYPHVEVLTGAFENWPAEEGTWERLKACPDCRCVFYDHTRSKTKVWCGMFAGDSGRACGTIAKVKRCRQRQRGSYAG